MYTRQLHYKSAPPKIPRAGARKGGISSDGNANSIFFSVCFYCIYLLLYTLTLSYCCNCSGRLGPSATYLTSQQLHVTQEVGRSARQVSYQEVSYQVSSAIQLASPKVSKTNVGEIGFVIGYFPKKQKQKKKKKRGVCVCFVCLVFMWTVQVVS